MAEHKLAERIMTVIGEDVVPLTRVGVAKGDKVFGAAILLKADLSVVVVGTNEESVNVLHHGEISALNAYYKLSKEARPSPKDCVFVATHEPCSLCLSAITWGGFDNFSYFFSYQDTRDAFQIPHDLKILDEVFDCKEGAYKRTNAFWKAQSVAELIEQGPEGDRAALTAKAAALKEVYASLSDGYQSTKGGADIPLA